MQRPEPESISLADFLEWEQQQEDRYEWNDGNVVLCRGGSDDHAAVITNMTILIGNALSEGPCFVRVGSERRLVPRDHNGNDLGSYYSDLFVSCLPEDRTENDVHYPSIVIEVLSSTVGAEFTSKKRAYLGSREIEEYFIIESKQRSVHHFYWTTARRLAYVEYNHGPVLLKSLNLTISLEQIYRGTLNVKAILRPVYPDQEIVIAEADDS